MVERALDLVIGLGAWDVGTGAGLLAAGVSMGIRSALRGRRTRAAAARFPEQTRRYAAELQAAGEKAAAASLLRLVHAYEYGVIGYDDCLVMVRRIVRKHVG